VLRSWPGALPKLADLPIDHAVAPVGYRGGAVAAREVAVDFFADRFARYADGRNHPDDDASSGLSPYLHFGHASAHEIIATVWKTCEWDPSRLAVKANGKRTDWWGLPAHAESFLDELITWRELGYGFCHHRADYDRYESLPDWAQKTLADHATDPRPELYTPAELEAAATGDEIWNAAQRQLVRDGRIHNYLRMLWGKKILQWSRSPRAALAVLIELNNKYAVDGRDPNSYSGIFWTLGRFDRPWGPVRPIFGTIRYMSSDATKKKLDLDDYLRRYGASSASATRSVSPSRSRTPS
jgi:deoxyribodipyrimidine photo-lyase